MKSVTTLRSRGRSTESAIDPEDARSPAKRQEAQTPLMDHLIERAEGHSVEPNELENIKRQIAHTLRNFRPKA